MIALARISDRARTVLVLISVAALIAASLAVAAYNERRYQTQVRQATAVQARVLADTVSAALSFGDRAALQEYVGALKANGTVDAAGVYDERGRLMASYARTRLAPRISQALSSAEAPGQVIVFAPVTQDRVPLGTVYVRDRTEPLLSRLSHYVGPGLLLVMSVLMFVIMGLDAAALRRVNQRLTAQIAEREKAEAALRQSQKMEAIGQLTGGIAHDFNNMLAIILGSLDIMLRRHADADPRITRLAAAAMEGANRAAALTQRLLAFSRLQPLKPASTDVAKVVTDMTDLLRRTLGETIAVETVSAGGLWRAHIDQPQLETAIVNLAINARDAMSEGGKLTVETGNAYLDRVYAEAEEDITPGQYVMVAVTDTGNGMAAEVLDRAFEPFFTTKPPGLGTGLGLSQVQGFLKQSGGHIRIYSEIGVGTTVKLYLPRSFAEPERARGAPARSRGAVRRDVTVLVVEDEAGVRDFAVEALGVLGYDVIAADGAEAALEALDAHPEVQLLLTDVVMSVMNGRALSEAALKRRPGLVVVFMTGY
ncbi:MAG TPA: ATP-binding protein, partial [Caulobacteraceae bacterium]|nr:ATP-binding protein [Caulobacteraceae bacterium]